MAQQGFDISFRRTGQEKLDALAAMLHSEARQKEKVARLREAAKAKEDRNIRFLEEVSDEFMSKHQAHVRTEPSRRAELEARYTAQAAHVKGQVGSN